MSTISLSSPAKLNLMLAVTGRRSDGFHDLVSVVAPVVWGDTLHAQPADGFHLECDDPEVPLDSSNLILKAATIFREATGWKGGARFRLEKRIPMGAGLGGGSSNAVAALRALGELAGITSSHEQRVALAAQIGSDCPLFLHGGPVVMRGRGEVVTPLPAATARRLHGRRVLIFKPAFGIATGWAYGQLAAGAPRSYLAPAEAEARAAMWLGNAADAPDRAAAHPLVHPGVRGDEMPLERLLFNSMEPPAFHKFPALPLLLDQLWRQFGLTARMSGSGSACFTLLPDGAPTSAIVDAVRAAWGPTAIAVETQLA